MTTQELIAKGYTVKEILKAFGDKKKEKNDNAAGELPEEYSRVLEHIGKYFKEEISLKRTAGGKGSMTIKFSSDEEMQSFLKVLEDAQI